MYHFEAKYYQLEKDEFRTLSIFITEWDGDKYRTEGECWQAALDTALFDANTCGSRECFDSLSLVAVQ